MGSIRKRSENTFQIIISTGKDPITGKYGRIYETVKGTKTEAKKRMIELEYEIEKGQYVEPSNITLEEFLHQWYEDYCENNLAPSTLQYYDIIINTHIVPELGRVTLTDLKPIHIQRYLTKKLKSGRMDGKPGGLSKKSVKRHLTTLSKALKHAVKLQIIDSNPAQYVSAPSPDKPEIKAMTREQVQQLLEVADDWMHDLIYLAVFTGMRRGELLAIRWQDVDFEEKTIHVRQAATKVTGKELMFKEPKTSSSVRPIVVDEDIIKLLRKRHIKQKENQLKLAGLYENKHDLVFAKANGDPYLPRHATSSFNKTAKKAGLESFRLHDLRHTHATLLLKAGVHPKIVQERLGHSSITQTLDIYSHVIPSMQKEAVEKLKISLEK